MAVEEGILEHVDALDVVHGNVVDVVHLETIDNVEWGVVLCNTAAAAHQYLYVCIRRTVGCRDKHSGQLSGDGLRCRSQWNIA